MELRASFKEHLLPGYLHLQQSSMLTTRLLEQQLENIRLHSYFNPTKIIFTEFTVELIDILWPNPAETITLE